MKKIVFLAFLYFTATDAFAACSSYTSSTNCNNDSSCYWKAGFGQTQTGQASGSCSDCSNTRKSFSGVLSSLYGVYNYTGSSLNSDYTYCRTLYSCASNSASVKVTLSSNWSGLTGANLTDYLNVTCEICSSGMYRNNAGVVFLDYNEIGALDLNGNVTSLPLSAGDVFQGCGTCGANAVVNSDQTNCNCKPHYAVYNTPSSIYGTTDIAERDCSPIIYTVYLNSTDTASTSSPHIKYKWGVGYELDDDDDYNDGTDGSLSYTEKEKQNMVGWYLSPTGSTQVFRPGALYDTTNVVTMCENALDCDTSGYIVHLYAKYSWKNYTVKYDDGSNKTKTCMYNSDCKLDYAPTTIVPDGKLFQNWQYTLSGRTYTIAQDGNIKEIEQTGEFPDNVVLLTPVYTDCQAGYYCKDNVKTECQPGTYCLAGVSAETTCSAGYYCPDTKNDPKECPAGYYCPEKSKDAQPCPPATTSGGKAKSVADCYVSEKTKFKDKNDFIFNLPITAVYVKFPSEEENVN